MVVKPTVVAGFVQQFGVRADLLDAAIIHHDDLIGRQNRGEPVGNCDDSASGSELFERLLNLLFRFGIERRRGFIKQKNRRIFQDGARNCETLLLSAGEKTSFVTNDCFVAVSLRHDEIVGECGVRRFINLFRRGIEPPELDVFENGVVK